MERQRPWSDPEQRWLLLSHVLFGVTLGVPTVVVAASGGPSAAVTVAIAAAFAAWYVALVGVRPASYERARALVYVVGALGFYTVLDVRDGFYILLVYSLLPQLFSLLPRALAVVGVVAIFVLPSAVSGGVGELLDDSAALFNLLASLGLALTVTAVVQALIRQAGEQQETISELERARADNERLLANARRDVGDRDALGRAGHALIAARSPGDVATAIGEHLAEHSAAVRGVALLERDDSDTRTAVIVAAVGGTANPPIGDAVAVTDTTATAGSAVVAVEELVDPDLPGVATVVLLSLRTSTDDTAVGPTATPAPDTPDLLWLGLATRPDDEMLRDLSTIAAEAALTLGNLRLAAHAAAQGRTAGVLAERQRLAHEIHDTLAQGFTSIVTQLEAAEQALEHDVHVTASHLDRAKRTARDSLGAARRTVEALRPQPLDQVALPDALRAVVRRWRDSLTVPPVVAVVVDGAPTQAAAAVDDVLLRVTQEALANAGRHAGADRVTVTLSYLEDLVVLDVQDDGVGFDVHPAPTDDDVSTGGYGLVSMRERITLLGGTLVVESTPGDGTTVAASVPVAAPARPRETKERT